MGELGAVSEVEGASRAQRADTAARVGQVLAEQLRRWLRPVRLVYGLLVLATVILCARGALEHSDRVNRNAKTKDQSAYLVLAEKTAAAREIVVDGARPPLYPAILALLHEPNLSRAAYFKLCKRANIALTLVTWVGLLFVLRRRLRPFSALGVWAALGFTVFSFYAPYVKPEGVFYSLAAWSFLALLDLLHRPTLRRAVLAGVITGVAQLTKESLLPAVALFSLVQALAAIALGLTFWRRRRARVGRVALRRALSVPVFVLAFLVTTYPHISVNKRVFGHYFYNVNSYFYVWYDSWGAVAKGTRAHGDRAGWPKMPARKLPSAKKYFASHSKEQVLARIERGSHGILDGAARSHGFLRYMWLALISGALSLAVKGALRRWLLRHWPLVLFCVGYFLGYFLFCTWFFAIQTGVRFFVLLTAPTLYLGAWLSDRSRRRSGFGKLGFWPLAAGVFLLVDVPTLLTEVVKSARSAGW